MDCISGDGLIVATATGVTDLENFSLTETSGIVGVIAKLPDDVAGTINALEIEAKVAGLPVSIKVTVNLTTPADVDSDDILKIYANAPTGFAIPAGAEVFLRFKSTNENHTVYTRYQKFDTALLPVEGKFNYVKFNCSHIDQSAGANDDGTSTDPYLIADKYQMDAVHDLLVADETVCFKMVDDVDMSGITWVPLNNVADDNKHYSKYISFDGDNHTLSNITTDAAEIPAYPSVFGVLNGDVANLNIDHATITPGENKAGVLAGYIGSSDSNVVPEVFNVHITNSTVGTEAARGTNYLGGVAAQIQKDGTKLSHVTIESSAVYGNLAENKTVGGMIAYIKCGATLENCHSSALVHARAYVGGIVGFTEEPEGKTTLISKCYADESDPRHQALQAAYDILPTDGNGVAAGGDMAQIAPGHTYDDVDDILDTYLQQGDDEKQMRRLIDAYGAETVERVLSRHRGSEYKRKRMPLVIERSLYED